MKIGSISYGLYVVQFTFLVRFAGVELRILFQYVLFVEKKIVIWNVYSIEVLREIFSESVNSKLKWETYTHNWGFFYILKIFAFEEIEMNDGLHRITLILKIYI